MTGARFVPQVIKEPQRTMKPRQVIRPGDAGFVFERRWWVARWIAWFMRSEWSHAFMVLEHGRFATYTSETKKIDVVVGTLSQYLEQKGATVEIWTFDELTDSERQQICRGGLSRYGETYGFLQLFSFAVRAVLSWVGIRIPNFIRQGLVCNQHVLYEYSKIEGLRGISGIDPESIHTDEWYKLVRDSGQARCVFRKDNR